MDKHTIEQHLDYVLEETNFQGLGERKRGKVRDVYVQNDRLILVTTDRYSAFDRNLALIPFKGQILNAITAFWFKKTAHIIPNHIIALPDPNVIVAKKCRIVPIEMVVRGYITGVTSTALWTLYQNGERDFGSFTLPEGLKKNQKLAQPVITPTTKAETHDRPLTPAEVVKEGLVEEAIWNKMQEIALTLFIFGQEEAKKRGLILVDTKYEFGIASDGTLTLADEVHTPDSSRYWQSGSYEERFARGEEPEYFDKEFLRLWFKAHSDPYKDEKMPSAPDDMITELSSRYVRIFEQLTGEKFEPELGIPIAERIQKNLKSYFL